MSNQTVQQFFHRLRTDFPFYCRTVIKIKTKAGTLVPYELNKMQLHLWSIVKVYIEKGIPLKAFLIKLRQGGATTFFTVLIYWLCTLWPYRNALGIAHDEDASQGVGSKWQSFFLNSQVQFRPNYRIMNRKQIHFATPLDEFDKTGDVGLDSHLDCFTIDKKEIGRSYTYHYGLLTEYARYPEVLADDVIDDRLIGVYNAIPDIPGVFTMIIKESTAAGDNYAKADWEDTNSGFINIFISWIASEEYRLEILPSEYFNLSEIEDSRYGDELEERKKIIKQLAFWWPELTTELEIEHEVYCRLAWRRRTIDVRCKGKKLKFKQEYPTSAEDAFTFSGECVFPLEKIVEMEQFLDKENFPFETYSYHHDDEDDDAAHKFYADPYGHLTIYESPIEGVTYVLSADGAQGIKGGDDSSAMVFRLPELVEVACFSDIIIPDRFAGILNYLGKLYNNAFLGCEDNDKGGYAALEKLVNFYHYPNLYHRINPMRPTASGDNIRYGWHTGPETRQIMIDDFTVSLEEGNILIKSKKVLTQCKSFVIIKGKPQAAPGKHDDLVITAMIGRQMASAVRIHKPAQAPMRAPKWSIDWHLSRMKNQQGNRTTFNRSFR